MVEEGEKVEAAEERAMEEESSPSWHRSVRGRGAKVAVLCSTESTFTLF